MKIQELGKRRVTRLTVKCWQLDKSALTVALAVRFK